MNLSEALKLMPNSVSALLTPSPRAWVVDKLKPEGECGIIENMVTGQPGQLSYGNIIILEFS